MRHTPTRLRLTGAAALVLAAGLLAGCGAGQNASTPAESSSDVAPQSAAAPPSPDAEDTQAFLARYGLEGKDPAEIVDTLDQDTELSRRLGDDGLIASVRQEELVLKDRQGPEGVEHALPMPADRTYISFAPFVNTTHECFNHSLTTCQGELVSTPVKVTVTDAAGAVIEEKQTTTFGNGFIGMWLPRDLEGQVLFEAEGKSASAPLSTHKDAPTCVTTIQLT